MAKKATETGAALTSRLLLALAVQELCQEVINLTEVVMSMEKRISELERRQSD